MYDSLKVLGLGFGALETEAKIKFWTMSIMCHPDKHKTENIVMKE